MNDDAKKRSRKRAAVGALVIGGIIVAVVVAMFVRDTIELRALEADSARRAREAALHPAPSASAPEAAPIVKGPPPAGPSCDLVASSGSCYEYANTRGTRWQNFGSAEQECTEGKGRWSREPCSREGAVGLCVLGRAVEHGTVVIMHPNGYTESLVQRLAICKSEEGTYTALP